MYNEVNKGDLIKMKKAVFLLPFMAFSSLISCGEKGVTYTQIDDFSEYFTETNIETANELVDSLDTAICNFIQQSEGFDYRLNREIDDQYYYEYAYLNDGSENLSYSLYLGSDIEEDCKYFSVSSKNEQKYKSGQDAVNEYNSIVGTIKDNVHSFINRPYKNIEEYLGENPTYSYYKGDDGSIKVTGNSDVGSGYIIYDAKSLLVKNYQAKGVYNNQAFYIEFFFYYPTVLAHKTPADIGYK